MSVHLCTEDDVLGPCPNHEWVRGIAEDEDNEMCLKCQRIRSAYDEMGGERRPRGGK